MKKKILWINKRTVIGAHYATRKSQEYRVFTRQYVVPFLLYFSHVKSIYHFNLIEIINILLFHSYRYEFKYFIIDKYLSEFLSFVFALLGNMIELCYYQVNENLNGALT